VSLELPTAVVSEQSFPVVATLPQTPDAAGIAQLQAWRGEDWLTVAQRPVREGRAEFNAVVWKSDRLRVVADGPFGHAESDPLTVVPSPSGLVVRGQSTHSEPAQPPAGMPAKDAGANAAVSPLPARVWAAMRGVSWQPGCPVGRDDLRLLEVNYWGFDGYRYRGRMVIAASVAQRVAGAFTDLYDTGYPIRQMRLPEEFGLDRVRGASDYEMMAAGNTSGFNCRYVVGRESERVLSPHAYGTAVDVNPWENPFASRTGIVPNSEWVTATPSHPAVLRDASAPAVLAFTSRGARWGGEFDSFDYHHFEW
jgi:hypothetical protein